MHEKRATERLENTRENVMKDLGEDRFPGASVRRLPAQNCADDRAAWSPIAPSPRTSRAHRAHDRYHSRDFRQVRVLMPSRFYCTPLTCRHRYRIVLREGAATQRSESGAGRWRELDRHERLSGSSSARRLRAFSKGAPGHRPRGSSHATSATRHRGASALPPVRAVDL